MTNTTGRTTLPAATLTQLLAQPGPITLTADTWCHTVPDADLPAVRSWLQRLDPAVPVRIGTAVLRDGTGTLLTLRTASDAIRLHQPAAARP